MGERKHHPSNRFSKTFKRPTMPRKNYLLALLLFTACSSTQPIVTPPTPVVTPSGPAADPDTVKVPYPVYVHDTTTLRDTTITLDPITQLVIQSVSLRPDTLWPMQLTPSGVDDWPAAQAMLDTYHFLRLSVGHFKGSHALRMMQMVNGQWVAYQGSIIGAAFAQNSVDGNVSTWYAMNPDEGGIWMQDNKGSVIKDLVLHGIYRYDNSQQLSVLQIDTLPIWKWNDGVCRFNQTSPYAGIVIDPFSAPNPDTSGMYPGYSGYYLPGMNQSGSTAIQITGSCISNFVVGILITAQNQQNGECMRIDDDQVNTCVSGIAATQAQAKTNYVDRLMAWGQTYSIFDCAHWGQPHSNGTTMFIINGVNLAGVNHELMEGTSNSFSAKAKDVYGEGLYMLGNMGFQNSRGAGIHFTDFQIDFQNTGPTPSY
jgi:hypothetical protein